MGVRLRRVAVSPDGHERHRAVDEARGGTCARSDRERL